MKVKKLIVPLAGRGTRFSPSSTAYPKELTHLVDKPVLQYIVEEAYKSGIKEIIFVTSFGKDIIEKYFSKKYQDDYFKKSFASLSEAPDELLKLRNFLRKIKFRYIKRSSTLGDGHSILLARPFIKKGEVFAVSMGDLLSPHIEPFLKQLLRIHQKSGLPVVSVEKVPLKAVSKFGVIKKKNTKGKIHEVSTIVEKPDPAHSPGRLILTGKYILTSEIFAILQSLIDKHKKGEIKLADALKLYAGRHTLLAYECEGKVQDTGDKLAFIKATIHFGLENTKFKRELGKFIKSLTGKI